MQLKYRGCTYTPKSMKLQAIPATITLSYRGAHYQRNAIAPQFTTPQCHSMKYRGSIYFAC